MYTRLIHVRKTSAAVHSALAAAARARSFATGPTPSAAKPRARRGTAKAHVGAKGFLADNWPIIFFGGVLAGAGYAGYQIYESGVSVKEWLAEKWEDIRESADAAHDPTPEMFTTSYLNMSGNPVQTVPTVIQSGERGLPYTTVIIAVEGVLTKVEFDRRYGYRHIKRPMIGPVISSLCNMQACPWFVLTTQPQQPLGDPNSIPHKLLKEEKILRTVFEHGGASFGRDYCYIKDAKPLIRVGPFPRYTPSTLLVDSNKAAYDAQPNNTLLLEPFEDEEHDRGQGLVTILAFLKLLHHLHARKEAKNVAEAMLWLKRKRPEIMADPFKMAKAIQEEAQELLAADAKAESQSLRAKLQRVHGSSSALAEAKVVSPHSTRYSRVVEDSMVQQRLAKLKAQQRAMQQQAMANAAAEEV